MKILVRLPNWLGDVVMSTAFINAVKQLYPDAQVDVIVKEELGDLTQLIPGINKTYSFSKQEYKGLSGVYLFGKSLRPEKYDVYFSLPFSLSSKIMGWAAGANKRVGSAKEGGYFLQTTSVKIPKNVHRVNEYMALLEQFSGQKITAVNVGLTDQGNDHQLKSGIIINFNSEAVSRRMPLDKAVSIVNLLTNVFPGTVFTFIGSGKDAAFVDEIITQANNTQHLQNYCGKTTLVELCGIMAKAKAVLTVDSGPAHLANAVGTPTIVLFGAGNEHNTAPYNKQDLTVIRYGQLSCEACVRNTCELYGIPKCMENLDELKIVNTLSNYITNA